MKSEADSHECVLLRKIESDVSRKTGEIDRGRETAVLPLLPTIYTPANLPGVQPTP